jgi:uncharacterized protein
LSSCSSSSSTPSVASGRDSGQEDENEREDEDEDEAAKKASLTASPLAAKIGIVPVVPPSPEGMKPRIAMTRTSTCAACDGKCCRYFALEIDRPATVQDFDHIRWYLAHEGTKVFVDEGHWFLEVKTPCRHLDGRGRCCIYDRRPLICRTHAVDNCEARDDLEFEYEHEFTSDEEFALFAEQALAPPQGKRPAKKAAKGRTP